MRFDREPWVKLYRAESPQHRLMSPEARMFRDFLLRHAEEDGFLLRDSRDIARDICRVVAFETSAARRVAAWLKELERVGYVVATKTTLQIVRFAEAQAARTKNAERQARWRANHKTSNGAGDAGEIATGNVTSNASGNGDGNVSGGALETLQREEKRREGDEIPQTPSGGLSGDIHDRSRALLRRNPFDARFFEPHRWPEVVEAAGILHQGLGYNGSPQLGQYPKDSGVARILEAFEAGFTLDQLRLAAPKLLDHSFVKNARKLHALTPSILREVLDGIGPAAAAEVYQSP